ncbi:hypothetical protein V8C35DRAFT_302120 [Trichoderma chlorosporum]
MEKPVPLPAFTPTPTALGERKRVGMTGFLQSQDAYDPIRNIQEWQLQQQSVQPSEYIDGASEHNEIAELSSSLLALFKKVVRELPEQKQIPKSVQISIERSYSALILWSDGFGIAQGRLNAVFNKSRKLRYTTLKNLLHIGRVLVERLVPAVNSSSEKLQMLCSRAQLNIETASGLVIEESCRQSDDSSSDGGSTFSYDDIFEIAEDLKTDTLVLSGLDPLFKSPIFDSQHEQAIENQALSNWRPEKLFSDKIENRFPCADAPLALHLGRANYDRYLRCQATRDSQEDEKPLAVTGNAVGTIIADSKFRDSGVGTSVALTMSYAETTMSYNHDGRSVRIPPLPKEAKSGLPFTCIACGRMVAITNNSAWKRHIYLDLQPYMCLDMSCTYNSNVFESRDKWISHLALDHEMGPKWKSIKCPLCKEETGSGKLAVTNHISKHLEEISLSALPVEIDSNAESENSSEASDAEHSLEERTNSIVDGDQETFTNEYEDSIASSKNYSNPGINVVAEEENLATISAEREATQEVAKSGVTEAETHERLQKSDSIIEEMPNNGEEAAKDTKLAPIKFKDAVGRKFSFPFHICRTWQGMEELIKQAFLHIDVLGPLVQEGHYDLTGPDGAIILPAVWERVIEPGWDIIMAMWPLDKPPHARFGSPFNNGANDGAEKDQVAHQKQPSLDSLLHKKSRPFGYNSEYESMIVKPKSATASQKPACSVCNKEFNSQKLLSRHYKVSHHEKYIVLERHNPLQNSSDSKGGQNLLATAEKYFKDQPDKLSKFRDVLAVIRSTEWISNTIINSLMHQAIVNIGQLCGGYPSFMHQLNDMLPLGYRVEIIDASTAKLITPDNESTMIQAGVSEHPTIVHGSHQADHAPAPDQKSDSISEASDKSLPKNQNNSEAGTVLNDHTSHYFSQKTTLHQDSVALHQDFVDEKDVLELNEAESKTKAWSFSMRDAPIYPQKFHSDAYSEHVRQFFHNAGALKKLPMDNEDQIQEKDVRATVDAKGKSNDLNEPQYCVCNKGSIGIMIRCDNIDNCKYKWFHLECVGLDAAPSSKVKWFCPDCSSHLHSEKKEEINRHGHGNKEILSLQRIKYHHPNRDIYIWPPDSNVPGQDESDLSSVALPPPLPPPRVMTGRESIADHAKGYNASSHGRERSGKETFLAPPSPSFYMKQMPPIDDASDGNATVPKLDRTMTDVYGDQLYNPNFTITSSLQQNEATAAPSDVFNQRINAANSQHLGATQNISPKDAILEYNDFEEESYMPLFSHTPSIAHPPNNRNTTVHVSDHIGTASSLLDNQAEDDISDEAGNLEESSTVPTSPPDFSRFASPDSSHHRVTVNGKQVSVYVCSTCKKTFTRRAHLTTHVQNQHSFKGPHSSASPASQSTSNTNDLATMKAPEGPRSNVPQTKDSFFNNNGHRQPGRFHSSLPAGWFTGKDATGNTYFYNRQGQSTWERPTQPASEQTAKAPSKAIQEQLLIQSILDKVTKEDTPKQPTSHNPGEMAALQQQRLPQREQLEVISTTRYGWSLVRNQSYGAMSGGVPDVTNEDFSYITSQDLDDPRVEYTDTLPRSS